MFADDGTKAEWSISPHVCRQVLSHAGFFRYSARNRARNATDKELAITVLDTTDDSVCCFMCGIVIRGWKKDVPLWEHLRHSPNCPFALTSWINGHLSVAMPPRSFTTALGIALIDSRDLWNAKLESVPLERYRHELHRVLAFFRRQQRFVVIILNILINTSTREYVCLNSVDAVELVSKLRDLCKKHLKEIEILYVSPSIIDECNKDELLVILISDCIRNTSRLKCLVEVFAILTQYIQLYDGSSSTNSIIIGENFNIG